MKYLCMSFGTLLWHFSWGSLSWEWLSTVKRVTLTNKYSKLFTWFTLKQERIPGSSSGKRWSMIREAVLLASQKLHFKIKIKINFWFVLVFPPAKGDSQDFITKCVQNIGSSCSLHERNWPGESKISRNKKWIALKRAKLYKDAPNVLCTQICG